MQSKNKRPPTAAERRHIERVKGMDCAVCGAAGPSECHEIAQGQWFTSMPLCADTLHALRDCASKLLSGQHDDAALIAEARGLLDRLEDVARAEAGEYRR